MNTSTADFDFFDEEEKEQEQEKYFMQLIRTDFSFSHECSPERKSIKLGNLSKSF